MPEPLPVQQFPGAIGIRCPEGIPGDGIGPPLGEIVIGTVHNTAHLASAVGAESAELGGDFIHIVQDLPGIGCKVIEDNEGMTIENGGMSVQPVDGHCAAEPIDLGNLLSFRTGQQTDLLIVFVIGIDLAAGVLPDRIPLPVKESDFTLRKGEILGVSGLMGAGRTELMKVLYGALPRTSGYVTLDGHEVVTRSPQDGLANGIVYISEDRKRDGLVLGMSVKENMSLTALRYFSRAGGSLKHADEQQAVSDFIRLFNVKTPSMEQAIGLLSGGNQQKVAIARGLMTRPKVLILDEPTRGVDVGAKKEIYQLINQFKADGLSIILVSSEMPEVLGMSDRIIVMHEGHLSGEFTREQATQEVLMAAAVGKLNRVNQE